MKLLQSRTFWSLVVLFVVNGYASISGQVPAGVDVIVNLVLTTLATYFHTNPSTTYNLPTDGSSVKA